IVGDNLSLRLAGGISVLDGDHALHDVRIERGAALAGSGQYLITDASQAFVNDGLLLPGSRAAAMRIVGDYRQGADALMAADFDHSGLLQQLSVQGTATLDGTLALRALPDWYASGWQLDAASLVQAETT